MLPASTPFYSESDDRPIASFPGKKDKLCSRHALSIPIRLSPFDIHTDAVVNLPHEAPPPLLQRSLSNANVFVSNRQPPIDANSFFLDSHSKASNADGPLALFSPSYTKAQEATSNVGLKRSSSATGYFVTVTPRCTSQKAFGQRCSANAAFCVTSAQTPSCQATSAPSCGTHSTTVAEPRLLPPTHVPESPAQTRVRITATPDSLQFPSSQSLLKKEPECDACLFCNDVCTLEQCRLCAEKRKTADARTLPRCATLHEPYSKERFPWTFWRYPTHQRKREFTPCQVSRHRSRSQGCWLVAHGLVYDATPFLDQHPAGATCILKLGGKDASRDYDFHSSEAQKVWEKCCIGTLIPCKGHANASYKFHNSWMPFFNQTKKWQCTLS